jgi:hypothetical protein
MTIAYSSTANQAKSAILLKYRLQKHGDIDIRWYFEQLEKQIQKTPFEATEEEIILDGQRIFAYKRGLKTNLFSTNFNEEYLHISLSYTIHESIQKIIVRGAYARSYAI